MTLASSLLGDAAEAVERAVDRSATTVLELRTPAETERGAAVLREVWRGAEAPVPANLLRTVQHTGGYVFGAYDANGAMRGVSLGLLASADGRPALHSHITGVVPTGQRRGLGYALKQHQRLWALERGLQLITWTCDPLVRRNVAFNLHALGAMAVAYLPDHYGAMVDGINSGEDSDRFELHWDVTSPAAVSAGHQRMPWLPAAALPWAVRADARGFPVSTRPVGARLVQLPPDVEALRVADPPAARAWRLAVREAVVPALAEGLVVRGLTAEGALVLS